MTQNQRARRVKALVALAAFALGALLHVILTDAFSDPKSAHNAHLDRPSLASPSTVSSAITTKQPSFLRAVRTSSNGKDQLDVPLRSVDWAGATVGLSRARDCVSAASAGVRTANRPRDPPST